MNFLSKAITNFTIDIQQLIDDEITAWHDSHSILPLNEFLGLTEEEFGLFIENSNNLYIIVKKHLEVERAAYRDTADKMLYRNKYADKGVHYIDELTKKMIESFDDKADDITNYLCKPQFKACDKA